MSCSSQNSSSYLCLAPGSLSYASLCSLLSASGVQYACGGRLTGPRAIAEAVRGLSTSVKLHDDGARVQNTLLDLLVGQDNCSVHQHLILQHMRSGCLAVHCQHSLNLHACSSLASCASQYTGASKSGANGKAAAEVNKMPPGVLPCHKPRYWPLIKSTSCFEILLHRSTSSSCSLGMASAAWACRPTPAMVLLMPSPSSRSASGCNTAGLSPSCAHPRQSRTCSRCVPTGLWRSPSPQCCLQCAHSCPPAPAENSVYLHARTAMQICWEAALQGQHVLAAICCLGNGDPQPACVHIVGRHACDDENT